MANGWVGKYQISTGAGDERRRDPIWILQKIFVLQHIYVSGLRGSVTVNPLSERVLCLIAAAVIGGPDPTRARLWDSPEATL
jgi:hypothetical protein